LPKTTQYYFKNLVHHDSAFILLSIIICTRFFWRAIFGILILFFVGTFVFLSMNLGYIWMFLIILYVAIDCKFHSFGLRFFFKMRENVLDNVTDCVAEFKLVDAQKCTFKVWHWIGLWLSGTCAIFSWWLTRVTMVWRTLASKSSILHRVVRTLYDFKDFVADIESRIVLLDRT